MAESKLVADKVSVGVPWSVSAYSKLAVLEPAGMVKVLPGRVLPTASKKLPPIEVLCKLTSTPPMPAVSGLAF